MCLFVGEYQSSPGQSACTQCDAGSECDADRAGQTACAAGYFSAAGSDSCTACGTGKYENYMLCIFSFLRIVHLA